MYCTAWHEVEVTLKHLMAIFVQLIYLCLLPLPIFARSKWSYINLVCLK